MKNYLISYDIFDDKRLAKVRKTVYGYALSGQKSALETPLSHRYMTNLVYKLAIHCENEDMVNFICYINEPIHLCKASPIHRTKNGIIIV